ncbi:hypothetical protein HNR38_002723 [Marinobacter oulmenensis]|uniref:Uncharacterized protein n=1 Tax=Marinobacter oulmenensis TaxID=643747 RepID=A0A840UNL7_9GAMM|nr:hypothetical protein [Marinobacter oulmenensis]
MERVIMDNNGSRLYTCRRDISSRLDGVLGAGVASWLRLHSKTRYLIRIIPA